LGKLFLRGLSIVVVPLVATSVVCGAFALGREGRFAAIGIKTLIFYAATGLAAVLLSLLIVNLVKPGLMGKEAASAILGGVRHMPDISSASVSVYDVFLRFIPTNLTAAAADNSQLLGIIVISITIGLFINFLPARFAEIQRLFWSSFGELFQKITSFVLKFLPIGVFGLVYPVCARSGLDMLLPVLWFFISVAAALTIHMFLTMSLLLHASKISPIRHLRAMFPSILTALSTSSSVATLPVTLKCVEFDAKVPQEISGFTIPLGATVNMNGTALYECMAVIFIAQIFASAGGVAMGLGSQILVVVLALLTSVGVAGIPSASLVAIVVIMGVVGIPAEAIGIIWISDRLLDMMRTAVNVYGDTCAAVWVAKSEGFAVYEDSAKEVDVKIYPAEITSQNAPQKEPKFPDFE